MTTQEIKEVITAYEEGKQIEYYNDSIDKWILIVDPNWNFGIAQYRVKPEPPHPEYVPYESAEEFLQAQKEHGMYIKSPASCIKDVIYEMPVTIFQDGIWRYECGVDDSETFHWKDLLKDWQWADGTPCGKLKGGTK